MATYAYRCPSDGDLEVGRPIGTAPSSIPCPACGAVSTRVITAPMLGLADPSRTALIDRTEATRSEPAVVSSPPRRPAVRPARQADPRTSRLPRP
ncbi:MAG: zinc ribbon domain-containing protein [Actinomycetota bacterium]|nr:zinc ribbon domain-containing protein [Actinomycetota bacterium]